MFIIDMPWTEPAVLVMVPIHGYDASGVHAALGVDDAEAGIPDVIRLPAAAGPAARAIDAAAGSDKEIHLAKCEDLVRHAC